MPADSSAPASASASAEVSLDASKREFDAKLDELTEAIARQISRLPEPERRLGGKIPQPGPKAPDGQDPPASSPPGPLGKAHVDASLTQQEGMAGETPHPSLLRRIWNSVKGFFGSRS